MYVTVDLRELPPRLSLAEAEDFGSLDVRVVVPSDTVIVPSTLSSLVDGDAQTAEWARGFESMLAFAATRGWIDGSGRIRAHLIVQ